MVIIKVALLFLLLVLLLRSKVPFTLAILFIGLLLGTWFGLDFTAIGSAILETLKQTRTISLVGTVGLVLVFSELLSQSGNLSSLSNIIITTFGQHRLTLVSLPALIGLLPMPGGALFSAPLVEEFSQKTPILPHKKTLINYWFRHIWEYAWPLYLGLLLAADLTQIRLSTLCFFLAPLTLTAILSGAIFILPDINISYKPPSTRSLKTFLRLIYLISPIGLIITLFLIARLPIWLCMLISIIWVILNNLALKKVTIKRVISIIFGTHTVYKLILMVTSVLIFVGILQASNLTIELTDFFKSTSAQSLPMLYNLGVIILFPFIIGLLTGLTIAFVGTTFPIIISTFIPSGQPNLPFIVLAYASGLAGVMLSPTHLCLLLSNQYFGSSLKKVYRYLLPMVLMVWAMAGVLFWIYINFLDYL